MDAEAVIWLLVMLVWFVSSIVKQIRGMGKPVSTAPPEPVTTRPAKRQAGAPIPAPPISKAPPQAPPAPASAKPGADDPLREIFRQLGVEIPSEEPVASEHQRTASEHRPTPNEHRRTAGEHRGSIDEHRQMAAEIQPTASEHRLTASEHQLSLSEHLPGDVTGPIEPEKISAYSRRRRRGSGISRDVKRQLRGGKGSLARAWLMKEILGPAPGLGPQGQ